MSERQSQYDSTTTNTEEENEMTLFNMLLIMLAIAVPVTFIGFLIIIPTFNKIHRFCRKLFEDEKRRVDAYYCTTTVGGGSKDKVNMDKMC